MAVTLAMIKELRELTGAGVLAAKKALEAADGDFDLAVKQLREKGLAKASKRADREIKEGRIESRSSDYQSGLLFEVNCETDFVARNDNFVAMATQVADHLFALSQEDQSLDDLLDLPFYQDDSITPRAKLENLVSSTGENMGFRRYVRYDLDNRNGVVEMYPHPGNRVAVLIELDADSASVAKSDEFVALAHDLALHIAAMAPMVVERNDLSAALLDSEKEIYRTQALAEGKPEHIVERIIEGRLKKFYEASVLLEQGFVKDDEIIIGDLLKNKSQELGETVVVRRFVRYELGEDLT
ncbi:MAG: translation elongation factor Ts [Chloroflexota bacterium]